MTASWSSSPLIPPFRFGTVENEVYRGAYPKQRNLRYLKRLKLKTILSLIPDAPDVVFKQFCEDHGIQTIHLPVDKVKDNVPLTYNRAVEAVQIIIDPDNLPIYIHCLDGASVTGLVVCCLRKLQTWNISSAMGEFLRYLRGGVISSEESVFVEKFASEIEISKPIPSWLWEGQITFKKHPTLKLKIIIPPPTNTARGSGGGGDSVMLSGLALSPSMQSSSMTLTGESTFNRPGQSMRDRSASGSPSGYFGTQGVVGVGSKSAIRTDMGNGPGFGSRGSAIATPTTALMARNKRAAGSGQVGHGNSTSPSQDGGQSENTRGISNSALGVRTHDGTPAGSTNNSSAVISLVEGSGGDHSHHQQRRKESSKEQKSHLQDDTENNTMSSNGPSDRPSKSSTPAQANVQPEVVDEYYEVSMTLKALALEGADW
ncbi:hypothetical protein BG004_001709 [Podila humilis]|nr:hypothetical protein BG004_001709 [Podila humilis]